MNRNINKLKKIFSCCGKKCSASTNGEALDELVRMAENGELGGGSSGDYSGVTYNYTLGEQNYEGSEFRYLLLDGEFVTDPVGRNTPRNYKIVYNRNVYTGSVSIGSSDSIYINDILQFAILENAVIVKTTTGFDVELLNLFSTSKG
jgi:hypothetical protein